MLEYLSREMFRFLAHLAHYLDHMITIKLRDAMQAHRRRTGERMTYAVLAKLTDISESTLRKIGGSLTHHTTLANIEKLCRALKVTPGSLLELIDDPPKPKRASKKKKRS